MITITGVKEKDRIRVARAIVMILGIGGVCTKEPRCAGKYGGGDCSECAAKNHIIFTGTEGNGDDP